MMTERDKEVRQALRAVDKSLQLLRTYGTRKRQTEGSETNSGDMHMTMGQAQAFLALALNETVGPEKEPPTLTDLVDITGLPQSTLSRYFLDLGMQDRNRKPGFGLLEGTTDPMNLRRKIYKLTPRGKKLKAELVDNWKG